VQPLAPFARALTPPGLEVGRGLSELLTPLGKRRGKSSPYLGPFVGAVQSAGLFPHPSDPVITRKVSGVRPQRVREAKQRGQGHQQGTGRWSVTGALGSPAVPGRLSCIGKGPQIKPRRDERRLSLGLLPPQDSSPSSLQCLNPEWKERSVQTGPHPAPCTRGFGSAEAAAPAGLARRALLSCDGRPEAAGKSWPEREKGGPETAEEQLPLSRPSREALWVSWAGPRAERFPLQFK